MDYGNYDIKEGFLCPICHHDFRQPKILLTHFQEKHADETDILTSLKELVGKAKNKILKVEDKEVESARVDVKTEQYFLEKSEPQNPGISRSHLDLFKDIRRERLDHRTSETNKLIIRLDRFLRAEGSDRKQVAQELVSWLDGSTVSRCPSCAASFNLTRRKHHCRLCGSIMCHSCSIFLTYGKAKSYISSVYTDDIQNQCNDDYDTLRICSHCKGLLDCRRTIQMSQTIQPLICKLYEELQKIKKQIQPNVDLYLKIYNSLDNGETVFQIQDAQALKVTIAKQAELMDTLSKKIVEIPIDPDNPRSLNLQNNIRRGASLYIKDHLLTLPALLTPAELSKKREQRLQLVAEEESTDAAGVEIQRVAVTTGWSTSNIKAENADATGDVPEDPVLEQINIVRNYIKQATAANRFEEVASLRANLNMLKEMHKENRKRSAK